MNGVKSEVVEGRVRVKKACKKRSTKLDISVALGGCRAAVRSANKVGLRCCSHRHKLHAKHAYSEQCVCNFCASVDAPGRSRDQD